MSKIFKTSKDSTGLLSESSEYARLRIVPLVHSFAVSNQLTNELSHCSEYLCIHYTYHPNRGLSHLFSLERERARLVDSFISIFEKPLLLRIHIPNHVVDSASVIPTLVASMANTVVCSIDCPLDDILFFCCCFCCC